MDPLHDGVKCQSKQKRAQGVTLLHTTPTEDGVIPQKEIWLRTIATLYPSRQNWYAGPNLTEHVTAINAVKGVGEI